MFILYDEDLIDEIQEPVVEDSNTNDDLDLPDESDDGDVTTSDDGNEDSKQTPEENAAYKKMRIKAQKEAKAELDKERKQLEDMRLQVQQSAHEKKIIDQYLHPDNIIKFADEKGISDEVAKEMLQYQAQQIIMTEKTKVADNFNKLQAKKTELSRHPQFASIDQEVSNVLSQHVTYTDVDYENLFYYTIGKKSLELNKDSAKVAEKKAIADIQSRSRRKNISGSDGGDDIETMPSKVLTKEGLEMSKAFKTDVKKVAAYVQATKRKGK